MGGMPGYGGGGGGGGWGGLGGWGSGPGWQGGWGGPASNWMDMAMSGNRFGSLSQNSSWPQQSYYQPLFQAPPAYMQGWMQPQQGVQNELLYKPAEVSATQGPMPTATAQQKPMSTGPAGTATAQQKPMGTGPVTQPPTSSSPTGTAPAEQPQWGAGLQSAHEQWGGNLAGMQGAELDNPAYRAFLGTVGGRDTSGWGGQDWQNAFQAHLGQWNTDLGNLTTASPSMLGFG